MQTEQAIVVLYSPAFIRSVLFRCEHNLIRSDDGSRVGVRWALLVWDWDSVEGIVKVTSCSCC